jgi:YHS domain-containing protein
VVLTHFGVSEADITMEALIYFAIWAGALFVMMRFGCGAHVTGHGQTRGEPGSAGSRSLRWTPPEKDADPVCGKSVRTQQAKPSVHDGSVYYFCSRDCREIFEAAPDGYLGKREFAHTELERADA